jgi:hypothetical protein
MLNSPAEVMASTRSRKIWESNFQIKMRRRSSIGGISSKTTLLSTKLPPNTKSDMRLFREVTKMSTSQKKK